jgi:16S rRNA (cytidine1402-2'-O)-methyltransferase
MDLPSVSDPARGTLFIVATPIGDPGDITLRSLEILKKVDLVVCEEIRAGSTLLKKLGVEQRTLITLNEHNEKTQVHELTHKLAQGMSLALISDCGTPVFADPGTLLIKEVVKQGIRVVPVPGPSSLMAALSLLDRKISKFYFAGFLPREPEKRRGELHTLKSLRVPIVIMDTPYRLGSMLNDINAVFSPISEITLAMDLTLPSEEIFRGRVADAIKRFGKQKKEFVLIVHSASATNGRL